MKTHTPANTLAPGYYVEIRTGPEGWHRFTTQPQTKADAIHERKRATQIFGKRNARIFEVR